ncbi:hypothetical protein [Chryseobacterium turcicum]|uniref:Uncharacterized protein n=1 Tax=Chryseobacterium turcicum TaxID=2898076 RepID=A0A9Q3V1F6_9FLAO|nr:hypothetical protein [Chryseobacterium turcicum]MCD1116387.1 hypothetical protein [Chryseobacterium turcicum]
MHLNNAKLISILDAITVLETELANFNFNLSPNHSSKQPNRFGPEPEICGF